MKHVRYKLIIKKMMLVISCIIFNSYVCFAAPGTEGIQVYQKNMHLSEEHKQKLAADIYRYQNADDMWDELRRDFILPHYEDSPEVQEQISWFMNHQDFLLHSATRAAPYLYFILQQVRKRHLPGELVLLPMIESAYNPFAYSTMGAAGIWQMMPNTASGFGVKQDWWYDGRRDVVASTRAALDYLSYLGNFFAGNWLLAIAAYDTGEGNVISAIRKNNREGLNTDFWSLPLAQETRLYIPRLLALATIIGHPEQYLINFPPVHNAPYLAQIDIGAQIDLKNAAYIAGLSLKTLKQLNPGYNRSATDPHGPFKLVLPIENVQQFTENLAHSPGYRDIHFARYKIKSGDTLVAIAKRFNISNSELRKANPLLAENLQPGKQLVIPRPTPSISKTILDLQRSVASKKKSQETTLIADKENENDITPSLTEALENFQGEYSLQPGDTLYMVRGGDDFEKIAQHFQISVKTLLAVNHLNSSSYLPPGKELIIPTHMSKTNTMQPNNPAPPSTNPIYQVKRGDDIETIAQKFHTTASAIRIANLLTNNMIQEGDQLVIPTRVG